MATKNNPGAFDCYGRAEPDEPLFVLLGRDKHAPALIWLWATLRELDQEPPEVVEEARAVVGAMINWQVDRGRQAHGLGTVTLAGAFELIRAANAASDLALKETPLNAPTTVGLLRAILARTAFAPAATGGDA